jgi:membrane associated rhomboid family serine protease
MIFPIGDDNSDRTSAPIINYLLIAINLLVFVLLQGGGSNEKFTYAYSTVPQEIKTGVDIDKPVAIEIGEQRGTIDLQPTPPTVYVTLLTSMFMHGGWMHLLGNMLFLWIFGDNLENRMGRFRYLIFYLVTGLAATLAHVFSTFAFGDNPFIPSLGASGAISGVLGGYLLLFVLQLIQAFGMLAAGPQSGGGVAFMAHVGGFVAGLILVKLFAAGRNPEAATRPY